MPLLLGPVIAVALHGYVAVALHARAGRDWCGGQLVSMSRSSRRHPASHRRSCRSRLRQSISGPPSRVWLGAVALSKRVAGVIPPVARSRGPHWPLAAALAVLLATVAAYSWLALRLNDGHFVYAQDDPYIHLALARTLAQHGVWGLSPEEFAPASSSPLWTVLLAIIGFAGGTGPWWPFALNVTGAVLVVWVWDRALRPAVGPVPRFVALVVAIVGGSAAHAGVHRDGAHRARGRASSRSAQRLRPGWPTDERDALWPGGMALALPGNRPALRGIVRRYRSRHSRSSSRRSRLTALWLGLAAALAPGLYAAYAVLHGGLPLPNSVLMKSDPARFGSWTGGLGVLSDWVGVLSLYQRPAFVGAHRRRAPAGCRDGWAARWFVTSCLSCTFRDALGGDDNARVVSGHGAASRLPRQDRVVLPIRGIRDRARPPRGDSGALPRSCGRAQSPKSCRLARCGARAVLACAVVLAIPLVTRAAKGMLVTVPATGEVYRQQYQMGLFFGEYYRGETVALNDIGAVSWLAPVKVVDLVGLASPEVADARRRDADGTVFFGDAASATRRRRRVCVRFLLQRPPRAARRLAQGR